MVISLIHPSRGRPEKSYQTSSEWVKSAGCDVELLVSTDHNDPSLGVYQRIYGSSCYTFHNNSVVEATNNVALVSRGDILLYLSDDFMCFPNWGQSVLKEFEGAREPRLIKVDDMLQPFHVKVLTIPIMNRALYDKLVYFWHPGYRSMFCDEDLYWTANKLGALKMCPNLKFEHQHVSVGKSPDDETYRNSAKNWDQGKAVFARRKKLGFPL
jgi:hypothetical protein